MKKLFLPLLLCLLLSSASAIEMGPMQTGVFCWPEAADESSALYVYRYSYPTAAGENEIAGTINEFYRYLIADTQEFTVPMAGEMLVDTSIQAQAEVTSEITCNNEDYLSLKITKITAQGETSTETVSGHTFALDGERPGTATTLPRILGILSANETDGWMEDRQVNKANELVCEMLWERLELLEAAGQFTIFDDFTQEDLSLLFYPEEDFYLNEKGDPVFFLQSGTVCGEEYGILYIPIPLEEIEDEL